MHQSGVRRPALPIAGAIQLDIRRIPGALLALLLRCGRSIDRIHRNGKAQVYFHRFLKIIGAFFGIYDEIFSKFWPQNSPCRLSEHDDHWHQSAVSIRLAVRLPADVVGQENWRGDRVHLDFSLALAGY